MIAASQIKLRLITEREHPERLKLKMWLGPYLSILTVVGIVVLLVSMFFQDTTREQVGLSLLAAALILVAYPIKRAIERRRTPESANAEAAEPAPTRT